MRKTQADVQEMIQDKRKKIEEIKRSVVLKKKNIHKEKEDSTEIFRSLMSSMERMQADLLLVLEKKQKDIERQAECSVKALEEEIAELKRSGTELEKLLNCEDHIHLLQAYFTLSTPPSTDTWDQIIINSSLNVKDMVKDLLHLQESINNIAEKMPGAKRHATSISACMYPAVPLDCQKEEIGRLLKTPLQKGDTWYLVDSSWFKTWKKYVGFDSWDMLGYQTCHPGPVDNSGLLTDSLSLKEHLIEDLDYILLPKEAWGKLISWYGLTEHQKPIARKVVEQGMFLKHCKVEVYLTEVRLCEFSNVDQSIRRQFSKVDTVACIEKEMHKIFNIPDGKKTRLWLKYISNTYAHLSNPGSSVQDAGIYHGQVVLVEQINNNGTWPRDAVPPPCQKSQKRNT
ncbi:ubiquitin carboxyl-terminal hydrolase 15-like isoform X3 [Neoarius graeffei]|nr:ubiquitin carboxyl-terminal hydrolase 15-like isoform X3 [Neoarius graeffei]